MKLQTTASGPSVAKRIEGLAQCLSLPKKMMESGYGFRSLNKFSRHHHWFPRKMTSEERAQKFHTDDVSLPWSGLCFWLSEANLQRSFRGKTTLVASRNVGCFLRLWVLKKKHRQLYASEWGQIKNKFCCNIFKNTPNFPLNVTLDTQAWWKENPTIIFSERKMNSIYMCITLESSLQSSSKTLVL